MSRPSKGSSRTSSKKCSITWQWRSLWRNNRWMISTLQRGSKLFVSSRTSISRAEGSLVVWYGDKLYFKKRMWTGIPWQSPAVPSIFGNPNVDVMLGMGLCRCFGSNLGMAHDSPTAGDRILLFTPRNLSLVLQGLRTLDFRTINYKPGRYLIGCGGRVHGIIQLYRVAAIDSPRSWARMRTYHKSLAKTPPYALPVTCLHPTFGTWSTPARLFALQDHWPQLRLYQSWYLWNLWIYLWISSVRSIVEIRLVESTTVIVCIMLG